MENKDLYHFIHSYAIYTTINHYNSHDIIQCTMKTFDEKKIKQNYFK